MNVHIEMLHHREGIRKLLHDHGWRLDRAEGEATYSARHPTVTDQATARDQLNAVLDFGADWTILPGFDVTWLLDGGRAALALVRDVIDERARTVPA